MKKYNCNNTLDYVHEYERMCNISLSCSGCPLLDLNCRVVKNITPEHIKRVQAWSDAHPEITLTDKQVEIFKALNLLGFKYIAKDANGRTYIYTSRPIKDSIAWFYTEGECVTTTHLSTQASTAISLLFEWEDKEPLCIAEALEQAEVKP
nr:MAG TPA: GTP CYCLOHYDROLASE I FEEDBACK REGULATORY/beta structure, beta sheet, PROTEIN.6A [Caudoviricetes sp.]